MIILKGGMKYEEMYRFFDDLFAYVFFSCFDFGQHQWADFYLEPYRQEEQRRIDEITNSENSAEWLNVERDNMPLSNGMMTIGHCLDLQQSELPFVPRKQNWSTKDTIEDFLEIKQIVMHIILKAVEH